MRRLDPSDPRLAVPNFPHGTVRGYSRGCPCDDCRTAHSADTAARRERAGRGKVPAGPVVLYLEFLLGYGKMAAVSRATGIPWHTLSSLQKDTAKDPERTVRRSTATALLNTNPADVLAGAKGFIGSVALTGVRAHIDRLVEDHCAVPEIATAAGVDRTTVGDIVADRRPRVRSATATAILRLTPTDCYRAAGDDSPATSITLLRSLQANGWPLPRLEEMLGHDIDGIFTAVRILAETADDVQTLAVQIGDAPGGDLQAAAEAADLGYYPPSYYNADMVLIESVPNGADITYGREQEKARTSLRIIALTVREHPESELNLMLGLDHATGAVQTARRKIGLRLEANRGFLNDKLVKPGQDELVALIEHHVRPIAVYESTDVLDEPDLDYEAAWQALAKAAKDLRTAAAKAPAQNQLATAA